MKKLNEKQKRFCEEYVVDLNGTQASIRAGYSKKTAAVTGSKLLTIPKIQDYLKILINDVLNRNNLSIDTVVSRIDGISLDSEDDNVKLKANDMLMKHFGGYEKDNKVEVKVTVKTMDDLYT